MSKFTNGPWLREGTTVYALMHAGWKKGVEQFKNRFYCSVQHDKDCSEEEAEANARLIAAAPDLLEALEALFNAADSCTDLTPDVMRKAQAAIKKARGES
jgi:hypothetical protein